jgi:hypothetical protein
MGNGIELTAESLRRAAMIEDGIIPPEKVEAKPETAPTSEPVEKTESNPTSTTEPKTENSPSTTEVVDKKGDSSLTTTESESPVESSDKAKEPSKYEKLKNRQQKEWDAIQQAKAESKAEKERLERERQEFMRERDEARKADQERPAGKFDATDYRNAAKQFREEGREDLAEQADKRAQEVEKYEVQSQERKVKEMGEKAWNENLNRLVDKHPDLKDSNSNLHKKVAELLNSKAVLRQYPDGIVDAVEIAQLALKTDNSTGLADEVEKLRKENAEFKKRLQPGVGSPSTPAPKKQFKDLSSAEQGAELRRMAMEFDDAN